MPNYSKSDRTYSSTTGDRFVLEVFYKAIALHKLSKHKIKA
ncbi:hypothetical protein [Nostoc commune]|nr:hypothetical protein [Nostoc commune]